MIDRLAADRRRHAAGDGGFTLIELLVVIVILGILAAVVVFSVSGLNDRGQDSACEIDDRTIRTAQEAHFATGPNSETYANSTEELEDRGFLSDPSVLHTTSADNTVTPATFTVTALGRCVGVSGD